MNSVALIALAKDWWHLPFYCHLPILVVVVSLVYSATRFDYWDQILWEALRWCRRMTGFLLAIAAVLFVLAKII